MPLNTNYTVQISISINRHSPLLNASGATIFDYKVVGYNFSDDEIETINSIDTKEKINDRYAIILSKGATLEFQKVSNDTFESNLTMLDGDMTKIIASMLITSANTGEKRISAIVHQLSIVNPLNYREDRAEDFYKYKLKNFLTNVAIGMVPTKPWTGYYDANGGFIVLKEDGDICYHFYDRIRFESYLFNNAYIDRPSASRHGYGSLEKYENGELHFKFNLQIRLK